MRKTKYINYYEYRVATFRLHPVILAQLKKLLKTKGMTFQSFMEEKVKLELARNCELD